MIKERYVNLEVARLLRDKGFEGEVHNWYIVDENLQAPTQQMACDWVLENYKIIIVVQFVSGKGYVGTICDISDFDDGFYVVETKYYPDIEPVYNEALKYVLTNLI